MYSSLFVKSFFRLFKSLFAATQHHENVRQRYPLFVVSVPKGIRPTVFSIRGRPHFALAESSLVVAANITQKGRKYAFFPIFSLTLPVEYRKW
ncbi:MAG TPA: hypothetical protein VIQ97_05735, partial [Prevotella sp.]